MANGNVLKTAFPVFNGYAPKDGPKALPVAFDFTSIASQNFDLFNENAQGIIDYVQSVYVDNLNNPNSLTLVFGGTNQRITVPAGQQGTYPVFTIDQVRFTLSSVVNPAATGTIILLNVPMPFLQWGAFSGNIVTTPIAKGTYVDASGTITAGGGSQPLFAANANRLGVVIGNPANSPEPLYINYTGAATIGGGSIELLPGEKWEDGTAISTQAITITATTTGHAFYAKELS